MLARGAVGARGERAATPRLTQPTSAAAVRHDSHPSDQEDHKCLMASPRTITCFSVREVLWHGLGVEVVRRGLRRKMRVTWHGAESLVGGLDPKSVERLNLRGAERRVDRRARRCRAARDPDRRLVEPQPRRRQQQRPDSHRHSAPLDRQLGESRGRALDHHAAAPMIMAMPDTRLTMRAACGRDRNRRRAASATPR